MAKLKPIPAFAFEGPDHGPVKVGHNRTVRFSTRHALGRVGDDPTSRFRRVTLYLHGARVAEMVRQEWLESGEWICDPRAVRVWLYTAGWPTATTRQAMNDILDAMRISARASIRQGRLLARVMGVDCRWRDYETADLAEFVCFDAARGMAAA